MESGAQVAAPVSLPRPLARKRDLSWQNQALQQQGLMGGALPIPSVGSWNVKAWEWDSYNFTAAPAADASGSTREVPAGSGAEMEQRKQQQKKKNIGEGISKSSSSSRSIEEDAAAAAAGLTLKLGGGIFSAAEGTDSAARANKRVRSGSPANGGNYPMCQVDDCKEDLSSAKDYHRRHKVCQVHSKSTRALVGNKMQRFCQQCSRFHDLSEFDEGKRSCRRRLAGHNKRRRKPLSEEAPDRNLLPGNQENATAGGLDIVNLIATIAHLQGNSHNKPASESPPPDRDNLLQLISKIKTLNRANLPTKYAEDGGFDPDASQAQHVQLEQSAKANNEQTVPSTMNLLADLSTALAASASDALASLSQGNSESSGNEKSKFQNAQPVTDTNLQNKSEQLFSSVVVEKDNHASQSSFEVFHQALCESRSTQLLQLFDSSDDGSPPKLGSGVKYVSSESSNPMEERSPSSSPPVTQKLFPLHSTAENMKQGGESRYREDNPVVELSSSLCWSAPYNLFKESERKSVHGEGRSVPFHTGFASSYGSDQSPSTSNSDAQDRTGRIIFKLFGKDPSNFPGTLKTQILNWLSNSPSEMESYIRPGCVVLSVYASMLPAAWEELEENLLQRIDLLIQHPESEFWRNGRFLVRTDRQLLSHKDGKIRLCKSWTTWSAPELTSVSPVAVVSGQNTTLVLKGRNLTIPGTKIYCSYRGENTSKEVMCSSCPGTIYDDSGTESFDFPGGPPKVFGRCFIEVENGYKGNSFPVIIADAEICQELRVLESDLEECVRNADIHPDYQVQDDSRPHTKNDVLHFLNELGWLFQRIYAPSSPPLQDFSVARFKYLFTFSVEHDWCALIKTLLDTLVERSSRNGALKQESLEMLSEIHLLNRAVKRKCRKMVDLLVHYSVSKENGSAFHPFPPDMAGPGGVTPLHLAASTQDSIDLVDSLTSDPQEIGLKSWNSIQDDNNQSPYMYAMMRNYDAYNRLVARKLADRKNGQMTITIKGEEISIDKSRTEGEFKRTVVDLPGARSCTQCALVGARRLRQTPRSKGLLQRPYVHSMLVIAAVCVCVCVFLRGAPFIGVVEPFKWCKVHSGTI